MNFEANCQTTAMGVMPHKDPQRALQLAAELDIPFWPQLPRMTFADDMFAQAAFGFPGARIDLEQKRVDFNTGRFSEALEDYSASMDDAGYFSIDEHSSKTYPQFLKTDFSARAAVRGQFCGPLNFGFRVVDEDKRPLVYNDDVRSLLFDFTLRKINRQYRDLKAVNANAFVWVDEPGLGWVFNQFAGYNELQAQIDYREFLDGFEGPRALHLCLNIYLPFLFSLGLDILSIDAFQYEKMPKGYAADIAAFLKGGGIISWGMVPTESIALDPETPESLFKKVVGYWEVIEAHSDITAEKIARQALLAPAKCCIKNALSAEMGESGQVVAMTCSDEFMEEALVERAFSYLPVISGMLKEKYRLL